MNYKEIFIHKDLVDFIKEQDETGGLAWMNEIHPNYYDEIYAFFVKLYELGVAHENELWQSHGHLTL